MTEAISSTAPRLTERLRPATERILKVLPGPRILWVGAWALLPWLNAGVNLLLDPDDRSAVWEQSDVLVVLNYTALSVAMVITLWGTARIARRLETLRASTESVLEGDEREPFRGMSSVAWPLIGATATALVFAATALIGDGSTSGVIRGATWFFIGIPIWTFLWTYGVLQLGLDRLGREQLVPDAARVDPYLGLRPLGGVASLGLWMLMAWLVPVFLTGLPDVVGIVVGSLVLIGGLAIFFLSLVRLHRQMAAVKAAELATARALYAQAYEPVRAEPTLVTLEGQRNLLAAADSLEKRAQAIHEWPIDDGTLARVITIATSVIAMMVARAILDPLGL